MRTVGIRLVVASVAAVVLSGCAAILVGAGAAGGYAISRDSVRNQFDLSPDALFQESLAVANDMGLVSVEDEAHGVIRMAIDHTTVTITIRPMTRRATELKVKARNQFFMPKIDVAQSVYNRIIDRL